MQLFFVAGQRKVDCEIRKNYSDSDGNSIRLKGALLVQILKDFCKKVLLMFEFIFVIAFVHWDKLLFVAVVALDQYVKRLVVTSMVPGQSIPIMQDFLHLTYVLNPGAAFGILPNQRLFFLIAGGILLIGAALFYPKMKKSDNVLKFGMTGLLSGAAANLIDRIQSGLVVDFVDFRVWPVFNIADVAIIAGMFAMIYAILFKPVEFGEVGKVRQNELQN